MPLLLAERDRDEYRRSQAALARETEIMKDVEGWEVSRQTRDKALKMGTDASGWKERVQYQAIHSSFHRCIVRSLDFVAHWKSRTDSENIHACTIKPSLVP